MVFSIRLLSPGLARLASASKRPCSLPPGAALCEQELTAGLARCCEDQRWAGM